LQCTPQFFAGFFIGILNGFLTASTLGFPINSTFAFEEKFVWHYRRNDQKTQEHRHLKLEKQNKNFRQ
jgi:hypothetical protein